MAHLYTNLGLKKRQPPAPSGPGSCWVQTKSFSWLLQRHCIGPKGPQRQALTPSPFRVPLVATGWSPWCPVLRFSQGEHWLGAWGFGKAVSFRILPQPDVPPLLPPGGLSPLSSAITASSTWLCDCPPPQVPLGGLQSSPGKDLSKLSCCTAPSSMWSWDPSRAQQRGKDTLQGVPS